MGTRAPAYVKTIELESTGRDAQEEAQAVVVREFMDTTQRPNFKLEVNYATGVGKGKAAIETAAAFHDHISQHQVFIGCFTEKQRDSVWVKQIATWGRMHPFTRNVRIECYASMHKITGQHFGLVILDEAQHHTLLSHSFFSNNIVDGVLILTATHPRSREKQRILRSITAGRRLIIKQHAAIAAGIINDFEVYVIGLKMNETETFKIYKTKNKLVTEKGGYLEMCKLLDHAKKSGNQQRIRFAMINRMRYVGACKTKTLAAQYIQQRFRDKGERFLTIASSIPQANKIGTYITHSETSDEHYKLFLHNKIDELVSINQLKEGENFDNLGRLLVIQVSSNPNDFTQITGRSLRLPIGQISRVFVLCLLDTQDVATVRKALEEVHPDRIKFMDLAPELYWK